MSDGAGHWARTRWTAERDGEPASGLLEPARATGPGPGGDGSVQFEEARVPRPDGGVRPGRRASGPSGWSRSSPSWASTAWCRWSVSAASSAGRACGASCAVQRLRRVAREAAGQCRRVWLPEISDVATFAELEGLGAPGEVVLAQLSGDRPRATQRVVAVGPEGGWSGARALGRSAHGRLRPQRAAGRDGGGDRRRADGLPADRFGGPGVHPPAAVAPPAPPAVGESS